MKWFLYSHSTSGWYIEFTLSVHPSEKFVSHFYQLVFIGMIWYLVWSFILGSCTVSPFFRFFDHLLPVYQYFEIFQYLHDYYMKIYVTIFSAFFHRNDLIFGLKLYLGELYHISSFQVCRPSTSCLLLLWNFSIPDYYMKISVRIFSAFVHRNDLIFSLQLYFWELYYVSPFQVCWPSTSCLLILCIFSILILLAHLVCDSQI